jgi:hypothetical protein
LADLLAERGDLDEVEQFLRARADAGYGISYARQLAKVLIQRGQGQETARLLRFGLNPDGSTASG